MAKPYRSQLLTDLWDEGWAVGVKVYSTEDRTGYSQKDTVDSTLYSDTGGFLFIYLFYLFIFLKD